jgi:hypothetical protein
MTDFFDVEQAVGGVEEAVSRVEQAVASVERAVKDSSASSTLGWLIWPFVIYCVIALAGNAWHSKWRYAIQYQVSTDKVTKDKEPHDCDFFAAPMGAKYCDYKPSVLVVRWATSTTGMPIISYDDGKTWSVFTPDAGVTVPKQSTVKEVDISWSKKES